MLAQFTQSCPTLCDPMDCSTPGLPIDHQLPELTQTHRWCHPTISSSIVPFSSCLQSFPESGSFQMSQFFASGGQSIEASASTSVLPMNIQDWFPLWLTGLISLQSKGLSRVWSPLNPICTNVMTTTCEKKKLFLDYWYKQEAFNQQWCMRVTVVLQPHQHVWYQIFLFLPIWGKSNISLWF